MRVNGKHSVRIATVPRAPEHNPDAPSPKEDIGIHAAYSARLAYVSAGTRPGTYVYPQDVAPAVTIKRRRTLRAPATV